MKVLPFKIPKSKDVSLIYQEDISQTLYDKLHEHEEIQFSAIVKGEGILIVGNTINDYKAGDILLIGSNLPHVFKSDISSCKESFMITLFFTKNSFGENFFSLGDFDEVANLFEISNVGSRVNTNKKQLLKLFLSLKKSSNLDRFIIFLKIMSLILKSETSSLSNFFRQKKYSNNQGKRMSDVMDFTMSNFHTEIDLHTISEVSSMTPNAFCRYFKQHTNKTFFQFLIEVRIENACRLLNRNDELVANISKECGFRNISNFNRKFKDAKGVTPSKYRIMNLGKVF